MNFYNIATYLSAIGFDLDNGMTFGERVSMGLQVLVFGMAVVFAVLILLWGILEIFRIIFYELPKKKAAKAAAAPAESVPAPKEASAPAAEPEPIVEAASEELDETELIAAITAAISVCMDKPQTSFRVVSYRRTASK